LREAFAATLDAVRVDVQQGQSLSDALGKHPKTFDHLYMAMVRSGETGGNLDASLLALAETLERQAELRGKIKSAMAYPVVALCLVLVIAAAMLLFIVPIFAKIFGQLHAKLPKPTLILMKVSSILVHDLPFVLVGLVIVGFVFVKWKKTPQGRSTWSAVVQRIPVFGTLMLKTSISRFTSTLGTLLRSGVPVLQALEITSESVNNPALERALAEAQASIQRGEPMSSALEQHGVIPSMVSQMIAVGEETGALDDMLGKIATFYDQEVQAMVDALASLLEPLMIVVLGGLVGSMIIALYLPMFSIDKVADEIEAGQDELSDWAKDSGQMLFRRTPPTLAPQFTLVSTWTTGQQYTPAAINTFLQAADFYLLAHARAGNHVVVTHEVPSNSPGRIKIPNACVGLGVRFMTPYQMLRIEQARFVLGAQP